MKKQNIIIGLLAIALAGLFTVSRTPAQGNPQQLPHSVIILGSEDIWHRGPNGEYIQDGLKVKWVESDQYAPPISRGDRLADTIAKCLDLHYTHEQMVGGLHLLKR